MATSFSITLRECRAAQRDLVRQALAEALTARLMRSATRLHIAQSHVALAAADRILAADRRLLNYSRFPESGSAGR
jgi:hypothetical protein